MNNLMPELLWPFVLTLHDQEVKAKHELRDLYLDFNCKRLNVGNYEMRV